MHRHSLAASNRIPLRFHRYGLVLLLALAGLCQVVAASARTATIRPGTTIPGTSFTWVATTSDGTAEFSIDYATDVAFLPDGRLAASGSIQLANGEQSFAVAVYRVDGTLDWLRTVTGNTAGQGDAALHVAVDPTGNVVAVGYVQDSLTRTGEPVGGRGGLGVAGGPPTVVVQSIFAISYTPTGTERWRRKLSPPDDSLAYPHDLAIDRVGNVLIAGEMSNFEAGTDFYVAKLLGSDGFLSFDKLFDGGSFDRASAITSSPSANAGEQDDVIAAGYLSPYPGVYQTVVYKIDGDFGAFNHWARSIERNLEPTDGFVNDVVVDAAGDVIAGGATEGGEGLQFTAAKLAGANGDTVWAYIATGNSSSPDDGAVRVALGPNGELAAGGYLLDPEDRYDYFLTRIDPQSGTGIWSRSINVNPYDRLADLAFDPLSGIISAAQFEEGEAPTPSFDVYRHDIDGNETWHRSTAGTDNQGSSEAEAVAVDSFGNVGAAGMLFNSDTQLDFAVAYVDCQAPSLFDPAVTPTVLPAAGGDVLTKVKALDNVGIDTIEVVVTDPGGNDTRFAMTAGTLPEYQKLLAFPANATSSPKAYKLLFSVKDATGNLTNLFAGNVTVSAADLIPPGITNCELDPTDLPSAGGSVGVTAQVMDNVGLSSVEAVVTRPDSSVFTVTMHVTTGDQYAGLISIPSNPDPVQKSYTVVIRAHDGTNTSMASCGTITVAPADLGAPVIVSCQVNPPSLPVIGGMVTVSAVVTDDIGVLAVTAIVTAETGTPFNVSLTRGSGDNWSGTFNVAANTGVTAINYGVLIKADDAAGNSVTELCGTVTVEGRDTTPPVISNPQVIPTSLPSSGGSVLIRATVTDARGVAVVTADVALAGLPAPGRRPRGGITPVPTEPITVQLSPVGGDVYEGTFSAPTNEGKTAQTYNVTIQATDTSENGSSASAGSFTVAANAPGRLQLSHTLLNFGLVNLNNTARRTFRIKNIGKGILTGEMTLPDAPFHALIKEGKDLTTPKGKRDLLFALDPGEVITVLVEFTPTVHGRYRSEIRVLTNDPTKKKASRVILKGLGCRVR